MIKLKSLLKESVTVSVAGASEEYPELDTVLNISFDLGRHALFPILNKMSPEEKANLKKSGVPGYDMLTSDGDDYDKPTGIINFYISGLDRSHIEAALRAIKERLDDLGIKMGQLKGPEQSGAYKSEVIRIPIENNPHANAEKMPELNMTNSSFQLVFNKILKLVGDDDWGFSMPVDTLEKALKPFVQGSDQSQMDKLKPFTYDPKQYNLEPQEPGDEWKNADDSPVEKIIRALGGKGYEAGMPIERLSRYFIALNDLVQWAKAKGYKTITAG